MQEIWLQPLGWKDPLDKAMENHSIFLPGEFHGQRSLVGYSPWSCRVWHDWATEHTCMVVLSLFLEKIPSCFFHNDCTDLCLYQQCTGVLFFPSSCQHLIFVFFFMIVIMTGASWYLLWFSFAFPWSVMSIFSCA